MGKVAVERQEVTSEISDVKDYKLLLSMLSQLSALMEAKTWGSVTKDSLGNGNSILKKRLQT
jgi:hypothetical protein